MHADGWDYTDPAYTGVQVYGSWCDMIKNNGNTVEIIYGCKGSHHSLDDDHAAEPGSRIGSLDRRGPCLPMVVGGWPWRVAQHLPSSRVDGRARFRRPPVGRGSGSGGMKRRRGPVASAFGRPAGPRRWRRYGYMTGRPGGPQRAMGGSGAGREPWIGSEARTSANNFERSQRRPSGGSGNSPHEHRAEPQQHAVRRLACGRRPARPNHMFSRGAPTCSGPRLGREWQHLLDRHAPAGQGFSFPAGSTTTDQDHGWGRSLRAVIATRSILSSPTTGKLKIRQKFAAPAGAPSDVTNTARGLPSAAGQWGHRGAMSVFGQHHQRRNLGDITNARAHRPSPGVCRRAASPSASRVGPASFDDGRGDAAVS